LKLGEKTCFRAIFEIALEIKGGFECLTK